MFVSGLLTGLLIALVVLRVATWEVRRKWLAKTRAEAREMGLAFTETDTADAITKRIAEKRAEEMVKSTIRFTLGEVRKVDSAEFEERLFQIIDRARTEGDMPSA